MSLIVNAVPAELTLHDETRDLADTQYPQALSRVVIRPVAKPAYTDPVYPHPPVHCVQWDPGAPQIREVVAPAIGRDGTIDDTTLAGARTVTLDLIVIGGPEQQPDGSYITQSAYHWVEKLAAMTRPGARPWLYVTRGTDTGVAWRLLLRGNPFSIGYSKTAASKLELRLIFAAPLGYFESPQRGIDTLAAAETTGGLIMAFHHPFNFGASGGAPGGAPFVVGGSLPVEPVVIVSGPCNNPTVRLEDGQQFRFNSLALDVGDFVQVDMGAGTVRYGGDPTGSMYHTVDWRVSTFWRVDPGPHRMSMTGGGKARIEWRDRRLTI